MSSVKWIQSLEISLAMSRRKKKGNKIIPVILRRQKKGPYLKRSSLFLFLIMGSRGNRGRSHPCLSRAFSSLPEEPSSKHNTLGEPEILTIELRAFSNRLSALATENR